ncbi:MAG: HD domain-containing protein [Alphaproteobacteria bacterium]|uniref:HD domain-containing protein n=1 Tax=Candidatus Nitrobium versatile TaxID=2884831 RepID=A0A953J5P9_9BACT|nr:HD domain-containing protein [Candidatus Nitrobium versatile]
MLDEKQKLTHIINLGHEIARVNDVDLLLERILTVARRFVNADAGSIYVKEDNRLKFSHTQNETMQKKLPAGQKLIYSTFSIPIDNESIAGYVASTGRMLNIPDVYELPEGVSYSFNKGYDAISRYRTKSVLTFPLTNNRGEVIGVLQLINAMDGEGNILPFAREDEPFILHFANSAAIAIERAQMTRAIILRMIRMAELRDPKETGAHVNRVASYAVEVYERWASVRGVPFKEIEKNKDVLRMAAMLHDVGKVAISDAILKKPARLDPEEFEAMKQHTYLGARLFSDTYSDFDEASSLVSLNHHERWDGNGYPGHINPLSGLPMLGYEGQNGKALGKKAEEIPPFGRVVAIADVYDALCSRRAYKDPWDEDQVLETMRKESGKHFDPEMIEAFFSILDVIRSIGQRYPNV